MSELDPTVRYVEVKGFPGYLVGNDGSVWTFIALGPVRGRRNPTPRRMKATVKPYLHVTLYRDGKPETRYVHTLVLEAFDGPCPPGMECRHLDGDKLNCRLENLMWGTHSQNIADQRVHGTDPSGERNGQAKLTAAQVDWARREVAAGARPTDVASSLGINRTYLYQIISRKRWR